MASPTLYINKLLTAQGVFDPVREREKVLAEQLRKEEGQVGRVVLSPPENPLRTVEPRPRELRSSERRIILKEKKEALNGINSQTRASYSNRRKR